MVEEPGLQELANEVPVAQAVRILIERYPVTTINILGYMQRGKTNTAKFLCREAIAPAGFAVHYLPRPAPSVARQVISSMQGSGGRQAFIIDDMSFLYSGRKREVEDFLSEMVAVAHTIQGERVLLLFIYHDPTSITPFMRNAQMTILQSIDDRAKDKLKDVFSRWYLRNYLYEYSYWVKTGKTRRYNPDTKDFDAIEGHRMVLWRVDPGYYGMENIPLVTDFDLESRIPPIFVTLSKVQPKRRSFSEKQVRAAAWFLKGLSLTDIVEQEHMSPNDVQEVCDAIRDIREMKEVPSTHYA